MPTLLKALVLPLLLLAADAAPQPAPALRDLVFVPRPVPVGSDPAPQPAPPLRTTAAEPLPMREPSPDLEARLVRRERTVEAIEQRDGPRTNALRNELLTLGALYREAGNDTLAVDTLERALHVIRANDGLYSLSQVPVLEDIIAAKLALGATGEANSLDGEILELIQRNPDDIRVTSMLTALADRRLAAVDRILDRGPVPQLVLTSSGGGTQPWDRASAPSYREVALATLRDARRYYRAALLSAGTVGGYNVNEMFAVEAKMINTLYVEITHPKLEALRWSAPPYGVGEAMLLQHVRNAENYDTSPTAVANALIALGDWRLLFSNNGLALDTYRSAHDLLVDAGVSNADIGAVLTPPTPVELPAMESKTHADVPPHRGYVDVAFTVSRYGRGQHPRAVAASPGTERAIVERAEQHVALTRFRPRFDGAAPLERDDVIVRYYYDY